MEEYGLAPEVKKTKNTILSPKVPKSIKISNGKKKTVFPIKISSPKKDNVNVRLKNCKSTESL